MAHTHSETGRTPSNAMLESREVRHLRSTLLSVLDDLLQHDGYGHLEVDMKILKRGQKEVLLSCGKEYRFVIDFANPGSEKK